jgi:hypothetical protein
MFFEKGLGSFQQQKTGARGALFYHTQRPVLGQIAEAVVKKSGQKIIFLSFFCQMYCVFQK